MNARTPIEPVVEPLPGALPGGFGAPPGTDRPELAASTPPPGETAFVALTTHVSVDAGGALLRGSDFRFDAFVGYHYFQQRMKAFGCVQNTLTRSPGGFDIRVPNSCCRHRHVLPAIVFDVLSCIERYIQS